MTAALQALASLRLTAFALLALGAGVVLAYRGGQLTWPVALPLFVMALNLLAAILTKPVFRRQLPLLMFHLALLAVIVLAGLGRMTYLKARVEVTEGQQFDGVPVEVAQGPWHRDRLAELGFANESFVIDYSEERTIRATRNAVRWRDEAGQWQSALIRENEPLTLSGYRFYITSGKGFAPVFSWQPAGRPASAAEIGSVHLPRFPSDEFMQQTDWQIPGVNRPVWVQLLLDRPVLVAGQLSTLKAPEDNRIVLRVGGGPAVAGALTPAPTAGELRVELRPGQSVELPEGRLRYIGLKMWMGYLVYYDWTVPWLLAASVLAVLALGWHFLAKFFAKPW